VIFAAAMAETFVEAAFVAFCTPPDFTVSVDAVVVAELAVELEVVLCMTVGVLFPITPPPPPPTVAAADLVVEVATRAGEDEERDTDSSTASLLTPLSVFSGGGGGGGGGWLGVSSPLE
jgi:hypothetical protein